jgi:hypothetical protein
MKLVFDFFSGANSYKFALHLRGDYGLRILRNAGTIEILETLEGGLNTFCIMRWT